MLSAVLVVPVAVLVLRLKADTAWLPLASAALAKARGPLGPAASFAAIVLWVRPRRDGELSRS